MSEPGPIPRYALLHVDARGIQAELAASELWDLGARAIEQRDGDTLNAPDGSGSVTLVASFDDEAAARSAADALEARYSVRLRTLEGDAWRDAWKAHFKTSHVGSRLVIRPPWEAYAPRADEVVVTLDPGRAFGTGTHASTRLVLARLCELVGPRTELLDVGCGSGILGIAALLLGARSAVGLDIEEAAIAVSRDNAAKNGVADRLQVSTRSLSELPSRHDLVVANIESGVLQTLALELIDHLAPGGWLIISGLLAEEEDAMAQCFGALSHLDTSRQEDWIAMTLERVS